MSCQPDRAAALRGARETHPPVAAPTYDAGGAVGDLHDAILRRLAESRCEQASDRMRTERVYRAVSVAAGYVALALGAVGPVAILLVR